MPETFRNKFRDEATGTSSSYTKFLDNLNRFATIYGNILGSCTSIKAVDSLLSGFRSLNNIQVYSIIFSVWAFFDIDKDNQQFVESFSKFLKKLTNMVVRYQVTEKSNNAFDSVFSNCMKKIREEGASIDDIANFVESETKKAVPDDVFANAFSTLSVSRDNNKLATFLLKAIEAKLRKDSHDRNPVPDDISLEHIIPGSVMWEEWLGRSVTSEEVQEYSEYIEYIGNKTLLFADDNSSASNRTYKEKLEIYKNGKFKQTEGTPQNTFKLIAKLIEDYPEKFDIASVKTRGVWLAKQAAEI